MEIKFLDKVELYPGCYYRAQFTARRQILYRSHKKYRSFKQALSKVSNEKKFRIEIINPNVSGWFNPEEFYGMERIDFVNEMKKYAKCRTIFGNNIDGKITIYGEYFEVKFKSPGDRYQHDSCTCIDYGYLYGDYDFKEGDIVEDITGTRDKIKFLEDISDKHYLHKKIYLWDMYDLFIIPAMLEYNPTVDEFHIDLTEIVPVTNLKLVEE